MLDQMETEIFKSISFSVLLHFDEQFVSFGTSLSQLLKSGLSMLNLWLKFSSLCLKLFACFSFLEILESGVTAFTSLVIHFKIPKKLLVCFIILNMLDVCLLKLNKLFKGQNLRS